MWLYTLIIFTCTVGWGRGPYVVPAVDIPSWCYFNGITCDTNSASATYRSVKSISFSPMARVTSGTLPSTISNLINLQELILPVMGYTGTIPASIYGMSALTIVHLSFNKLTGTIDSSICTATKLVSLSLQQNLLGGTIPSTIGSLGSLTLLDLRQNSLSGAIPSTIVSLTNLRELVLYSNSLTCTIPDNIGNMRTYLRILNLGYNQLIGTIPSTFNQLTLDTFSLFTNYLTMGSLSTVPSSTFSSYTINSMSSANLGNNCLAFAFGTIINTATRCPTPGKLIIW